jgi:histidine triad (HIT) family protein
MSDCIFCRIAGGEIPSTKVYEDDEILAFKDIHPQAAVHFLIIPKRHITSLAEVGAADAPLLGRMLALAPQLARELGLQDGFRTLINTGRIGGQEVAHLHLHVLGGPVPLGPMLARQ